MKPYMPTRKKALYGTQARDAQQESEPYTPSPRYCAICNLAKPDEWYEFMKQGWVCEGCKSKATHIERESQSETHGSESCQSTS
jgi:hypothetical protein